MKTISHKVLFTLFLAFFVISALLSGNSFAIGENQLGIKVMQKEELGSFLAAASGMTLYSYSKDEIGVSNCNEGCAVNWPPFYVNPAAIFEGCEGSDFTTITRTDGRLQTTYKNAPLYYFKNDKYPGDTFGNGIGKVWSIVKP
jgi:predicted lipoprotein with Yx(FWY)xxD motif